MDGAGQVSSVRRPNQLKGWRLFLSGCFGARLAALEIQRAGCLALKSGMKARTQAASYGSWNVLEI